MITALGPGDIGYISAAVITGVFGTFIAWQNYQLGQKVKTKHGKNIGEHLESVGVEVKQAHLAAQLIALELAQYKAVQLEEALKKQAATDLIALQLETYKQQQADRSEAERKVIEGYVTADAQAHAELRSLIVQVATSRPERLGG